MVFQYKIPKVDFGSEPAKPGATTIQEGLSGSVMGKKASDLEERFAKALNKLRNIQGYRFGTIIDTPYQIPGQSYQVDFVVNQYSSTHFIEIDGEYAHKTAEQKSDDFARDQILGAFLNRAWPGAQPIVRVEGWRLSTQFDADLLVRRLF